MYLGFFTKRGETGVKDELPKPLYLLFYFSVLPEKFTMIKVMIFMIKKNIYIDLVYKKTAFYYKAATTLREK